MTEAVIVKFFVVVFLMTSLSAAPVKMYEARVDSAKECGAVVAELSRHSRGAVGGFDEDGDQVMDRTPTTVAACVVKRELARPI